jgi:hypothetical protein
MWLHWQNRMAQVWEHSPPASAEIDVAEMALFDMLCCINECCHDAKVRKVARKQLMHPTFARQHQIAWRMEQERRRRWKQ